MAHKITLAEYAESWLASRSSKRASYQEGIRWAKHLVPLIKTLRPDQVTVVLLKGWLQALRTKGLSNGSIRLCVAILSAMYSDLVEEGLAQINPTRMLSKKTRAEYLKSSHDPRKVPFLADPADALRIHAWLCFHRSRRLATAYALGAFAGLRTGEIRALAWENVDLERKLITVKHSVEQHKRRPTSCTNGLVPTKNGVARVIPIFDILAPLLGAYRVFEGLVCPGEGGGFLSERDISEGICDALRACDLPQMSFYQATRHSFASQWVLAGGNIHTLSTMMGHHSVVVTESHYVHLVPGRYTDEDRARIAA